jgi:hypothetical protein
MGFEDKECYFLNKTSFFLERQKYMLLNMVTIEYVCYSIKLCFLADKNEKKYIV